MIKNLGAVHRTAPSFFNGALTQLRIRILRWHGIEGAEETISASHYCSALQSATDNPSGLPQAATHLPLHKGGNGAALVGTSVETVGASIARPLLAAGATAVEAMRLWILPIHLLRQLGYESAD